MLWGLGAACGSEVMPSAQPALVPQVPAESESVRLGLLEVQGTAAEEGVGAAIGLGMAVLPASRISWRLPPRALAAACSRESSTALHHAHPVAGHLNDGAIGIESDQLRLLGQEHAG